jgi:L-threonylcarbamoyladenylate synthase
MRVLELKARSPARGLILIGASAAVFAPELEALGAAARAEVESSWPGPDTWIVPNVRFPRWITGAHRGVAIRVPGHAQARALCQRFGGPLVSTSANPSGRPPPRTALGARRHFSSGAVHVLAGETLGRGRPSRIRVASTGVRLRS